jgi:hypothetical protein
MTFIRTAAGATNMPTPNTATVTLSNFGGVLSSEVLTWGTAPGEESDDRGLRQAFVDWARGTTFAPGDTITIGEYFGS